MCSCPWCGLIILLSADLLLWLNSVSDDTVHLEIEMEAQEGQGNTSRSTEIDSAEDASFNNATECHCRLHPPCLTFRKGIEILFPFNIEFYLMAGCMIYVMWKNVGRHIDPAAHSHQTQKFTLRVVYSGGIFVGLLLGVLVLVVGSTIFILYQVWVNHDERRLTAFVLFYSFHLVVMPLMSLCSLAGVLVHKLDRRAHEDGHNPTRSLDVMLLVAAALGQLMLSYFSLVAALADGVGEPPLGALDLSYSLLTLLELVLQNVFIIEGLHRHPSLRKGRVRGRSLIFKKRKNSEDVTVVDGPVAHSLVDEVKVAPVPPSGEESNRNHQITRRVIQEICSFLILANIMLWVIPAFGANPQFKNGVGKQFYGFTAWFILVNLGQPLGVFYRMHSVGALMELLILA
ncbi:proton channel OTOP3-like [Sardina pilchardus]|uniref:proton channel OTOP3-like n=1 Tax=Sardina pilchardus TaxID=27697 RepID=UPI002E14F53C